MRKFIKNVLIAAILVLMAGLFWVFINLQKNNQNSANRVKTLNSAESTTQKGDLDRVGEDELGKRDETQAASLSADEAAEKIYQDKYQYKPDFNYEFFYDGNRYISGCYTDSDSARNFVIVENINGEWQERFRKKDDFFNQCSVSDPRVIINNGRNFLFFYYYDMGTSLGSIKFNVISLDDFKGYSITADATYGDDNGLYSHELTASSNLDKDSPIYRILTDEMAANSSPFYQNPISDIEIESYQNAQKRWELNNNKASELLLRAKLDDKTLVSLDEKRYSENLFEKEFNSIAAVLENDNYELRSYYKGSIIAYDKKTNQYFVAWGMSRYDYATEMRFVSPSIIETKGFSTGKPRYIDLRNGVASNSILAIMAR